jgi:glycosyltransferase involved in cell wall biosynthesis
MRIGLFSTTVPEQGRKLGGVEVVFHRLANALVDIGHEITVYSLSEQPPSDARYRYRRLFSRLPWLRTNTLARLFLLPWLLNFIRFTGCDVLHLHGDDWFYFIRRLPTIRTMHGSALREAQSATNWKRKLLLYLVFPLEWMAAKLATVCFANGSDAVRLYGLKDIVGFGVDMQFFYPGEKSDHPTIFFLGTWLGRKRGHFIYQCFVNDVIAAVPNARLIMACDVKPENIHHQVTFVDFPTDQLLGELYRKAWIFAYPSVYEGFGVPYIEALASGTAIVTTANCGANDVLERGRYACFADDEFFSKQIIILLLDHSKRALLSEQGVFRAEQFSWQSIADQHISHYLSAQQLF